MQKTAIVIFFTFLLSPLAAHLWAQGTYTAASCNQSDVNAVINGPTHTAVDGDIIQVPPGSCTWTSGITVSPGIGITIQGNGTPNSTAATTGASGSCTATTITISGAKAFGMKPTYGNSTSRLSCMQLTYGGGASIAFTALGTCTASGCPKLRVDNLTFTNWTNHANAGISYGLSGITDVFGVLDHNFINGTGGNYLQLVEFSHASYLGVGLYGDNSWHQLESYGTQNFLYIENNTFNAAGCCENEGSGGGFANEGGGRVVVRFNRFNNMDNVNFTMGWHGTESSGRPRSTRAFEYYGNTQTCAASNCYTIGSRGGTGLVWGNTVSHPVGSLDDFFIMNTFRAWGNLAPWGACDGSSVYDINDGVTYFSGTVGSVSGQTITVSGTNPSWTTNQWAPAGAPYSVHDVTKSTGSEIIANGSNTLTINIGAGQPGDWSPIVGDSIQILRATACIDQAGGRGTGILYNPIDVAAPTASSAEVLSPTYVWSNLINDGAPGVYVRSTTARVMRSRDFYTENLNQAQQSNSTTPFDGTNTIGAGHGTLGNRPTTCTTGVGYWATDQGSWNHSGSGGQGQLYTCTVTNTWTLYYTPYTYPHPLTTQGTGTTPAVSPAPPTSLESIAH